MWIDRQFRAVCDPGGSREVRRGRREAFEAEDDIDADRLPEEFPDLGQEPEGNQGGHQRGEAAQEKSTKILSEIVSRATMGRWPRTGACRRDRIVAQTHHNLDTPSNPKDQLSCWHARSRFPA